MDRTHCRARPGIVAKMQPCARQRQARQPPHPRHRGARGRALAKPGAPRGKLATSWSGDAFQ
eukprot:8966961-Pyramimonas_sp.AAC.1